MKTLNKTLVALVTGALLTTGASAAVSYGNGMTGQAYIGAKAGQFDVDAKDMDTDGATAYGIYGGYNLGQGFGVELDYMTSGDADYTDADGAKGEYNASTLGGYGTYTYHFPSSSVYAKGKLGLAQAKMEMNDKDYDDTGLSAGVGLGLDVNPNLAIEGEYTRLPSIDATDANVETDADLFTIGAKLKF